MSDCSVAAIRFAHGHFDSCLPAFLLRQRNQRRLTLEMLSANEPGTYSSYNYQDYKNMFLKTK